MVELNNFKFCPAVIVANPVVRHSMIDGLPFVYYLHHHENSHAANVGACVVS